LNIFIKNIQHDIERLTLPELADENPIVALLGYDKLSDVFTGQQEYVFDYIFRHSFQQPRDILHIGREIVNLAPKERKEDRIMRLIFDCINDQIKDYLYTSASLIGGVDLLRAISYITSSILHLNDLKQICCEYNCNEKPWEESNCGSCESPNIFLILYQLGLLGIIQNDSGGNKQRFLSPGYNTYQLCGQLPNSSFYIIHPALCAHLLSVRSNFSISSPIKTGNNLPWVDSDLLVNPIMTTKQRPLYSRVPNVGSKIKLELHEILSELVCDYYTFEEKDPPPESAKFRQDISIALGKVFGEEDITIMDLGCGEGPMITALNNFDPDQLKSLTYIGINHGSTSKIETLIKETSFTDKVKECRIYTFDDLKYLKIPCDFIIIIDVFHHLNPILLDSLMKVATESINLNKSIFVIETEKHRELDTFLWSKEDFTLLFRDYDFLKFYSGKSIINLSGVDTETTIVDIKRVRDGLLGLEFREKTILVYTNKKNEIRNRIKVIENILDKSPEDLEEISRLMIIERKVILDIEEAEEFWQNN
jgi:hypothetical protein